jgi:hypothetical protein
MKRALVLTFALILGLGIAASAQIKGSWCTDIVINPQTPAFKSFNSTLIVDYTVGGWTFESISGFQMTGWKTQEFKVNGTLGAFTLASDLIFNPAAATFTSWTTTGSVSIAGVTFDGTFLLENGIGVTLGASGAAGPLTAAVALGMNMDEDGSIIREGDYCFCFDWIEFTFHFPFCCITDVMMEVSFSRVGFEDVEFTVVGIPVPGIDWLTLDAFLRFGVGVDPDAAAEGENANYDKTLTLTPVVNFPAGCFTLYSHIIYTGGTTGEDDLVISGLSIDGIALKCTIGAVKFSDYSSLSPSYNKLITGDAAYWEKFCLESAADSCCGGAFSFKVCLYFTTTSTQLFDLGKTAINLSYGLGSNFTVKSNLVVLSTGVTEWGVGFCVYF